MYFLKYISKYTIQQKNMSWVPVLIMFDCTQHQYEKFL